MTTSSNDKLIEDGRYNWYKWVVGIFREEFSAVPFGGGLYRGGTHVVKTAAVKVPRYGPPPNYMSHIIPPSPV